MVLLRYAKHQELPAIRTIVARNPKLLTKWGVVEMYFEFAHTLGERHSDESLADLLLNRYGTRKLDMTSLWCRHSIRHHVKEVLPFSKQHPERMLRPGTKQYFPM